jgi:hypothetical protein
MHAFGIDPQKFSESNQRDRGWHRKDGDRHLNQVALLRGPLVLFAISKSQQAFDKAELLRAALDDKRAGELIANPTEGSPVSRWTFMSIPEESYSPYVQLRS